MGRFMCFQPIARNFKSKQKSCQRSIEAMYERVLLVNGLTRSSLESISGEVRDEKVQVDGLSPPSIDSTMPITSVKATPRKVQVNGLSQPSVDSTMRTSAEPMQVKLQVNGLSHPSVDSMMPTSSNSPTLNSEDTHINNESKDSTGLVPVEPACNSEDTNSMNKKSVGEVRQTARLKKSKSTESRVDNQWRIACADEVTEDKTDSHCLCDCHGDQYRLLGINDEDGVGINGSSLFPFGDAHKISGRPTSDENISDSDGHKSLGATEIPKSHSEPSIHPTSAKCVSRLRSCEDLHVLDTRQDASSSEFDSQATPARDHGCIKCKEAHVDDGYESYNHACVARDWIMPVGYEANLVEIREGECSIQCSNELPGLDFGVRRIEEWMNDLQHCDPLGKCNESSESTDLVIRETKYLESPKATAEMEAGTSYISALGANAVSAQFINQGLVAIPFLSAFSSLKVLNLSGNAIVRITAGSLPRGLHILNLSKNSISTIEGLRELTRLRVLDLSYNRIVRIGHGLASCSTLKELYLAGNKISEVEGLHRLLKLIFLDLRYNKISTAKCLGQLAANSGSLQAIHLEGNPAQKNVGDEHLKKTLQSLLPRLAYYNRQSIKVGILKGTGERKIVKLGPSSHQFGCSSKPDKKSSTKSGPASSGRANNISQSRE